MDGPEVSKPQIRSRNELEFVNNSFAQYYRDYSSDVQLELLDGVFGRYVGQRSWCYADELESYVAELGLGQDSVLLDYGCGHGGPDLFLVGQFGLKISGIDVNPDAIASARRRADAAGVSNKLHFALVDNLMSEAQVQSFDAVLMNDVICHISQRKEVLRDCCRLLKPGAKMIVTDPLVVTGMISNDEMNRRSFGIPYFYAPQETNREAGELAGLQLIRERDTTKNLIEICQRELEIRPRLEKALREDEGDTLYEKIWDQINCILTLAREGRLSRMEYLWQKPPE